MNGKHFIGNQQLSRKLIGRTKEALRQRNVQFAQAHGDASDEALLDYVRSEAARFGGWQNVITSAGLPSPKKQKPTSKRQIFKEEFRCQAESGSAQSNVGIGDDGHALVHGGDPCCHRSGGKVQALRVVEIGRSMDDPLDDRRILRRDLQPTLDRKSVV